MRTSNDRKSGGQPGHRGAHPKPIKPKDQRDSQERHPVGACTGCGTDLSGAPIQKQVVRQICNIPGPQARWNEPIAEVKQCPCCKPKNQATSDNILDRYPSSKVMYGPNIRAYVLYLSLQQIISLNRIAAHVSDFYGVPVSTSNRHHFGVAAKDE